jgi:TonB-dependent receptor
MTVGLLVALCGPAPLALAATCRGEPLSAALLRAGRESHLQLMFDPKQVSGLCAPDIGSSGDRVRDIEALARSGGFQMLQVGPGLLALNRTASSRGDHLSRPSAPARLSDTEPDPVLREVLVRGRSAGRLRSEDQDRTGLATVLSVTDGSRYPAANIVDAVSILAGVSAYSDMGLGQSATGNPEFITVRGLDASYNAYEFNGVVTPQSDPNSRGQSLKVAPALGVQSVAILKTPMAEDEGAAIGGIVDIRTPTAFDVPSQLNRLTVRSDLSDLAIRTGFEGIGGLAQVEIARRYLGGRLGVYATAYYGQSHSVAESGEVGTWAPTYLGEAGVTDYSKVSQLTAAQYKYDFYTNRIQSFGGNLSVDYCEGASTLYVRMTAANYDDLGTDSQVSVRHGLVNTGTNAAGQIIDFWGRPTGPGLPGDPAYAPQQTSANPVRAVGGADYNDRGVYDPSGVGPGAYFQLRDQMDRLYAAQIGGTSVHGRFSLAYNLSYGYALHARPNYLEASWYGAPLEEGRAQIGWANAYTPRIAFSSPAVATYVFSQTSSALWKFQGIDSASDDGVAAGRFDASYRTDGAFLTGWRAGAKVSVSDRSQYTHNLFGAGDGNLTIPNSRGYATPYWAAAGPSIDRQPGQDVKGTFLGFPGHFRVFSRGALLAAARPYFYQSHYAIDPVTGLRTWPNPGDYSANDYYGGTAASREGVSAGYLSGDFAVGDLAIHPGLRFEYTRFRSRYWSVDTAATGHFATTSRSYGEWLPSLHLVWHPLDRLVGRASFRRSFSRPVIGLLAGPTTVSGNGLVTEGNPDLKPTTALNYDVSLTYDVPNGAVFRVAAFRKELSNFIYAANVTGSAPQANYIEIRKQGVNYSTPENGRSAWLEGLELEGRWQLVDLPGPFSGLGLAANATLQESNATNGRADHFGRRTWLPRVPQTTYNLDMFWAGLWAGTHIQTDLAFQYTGRQLENLTSDNADNFLQPRGVLNWSASADVQHYKVSLSVRNLTDTPVFWKTLGESKRYLGVQDGGGNGAYVLSGRVASVTVARTW